jgi:hypothetical protein
MTTELEFAYNTYGEHLSDQSKAAYKSAYNRFMTVSNNKQIHSMSQERLVEVLDNEIGFAPQSKNQITSVFIIIKKAYDMKYDIIKKYRDDKLRKQIIIHAENKKKEVKDTLPTMIELKLYLKKLLKEEEYQRYIINWLLINMGVRNLDLDLTLTTDRDVLSKKHPHKGNYIVVLKNYLSYIRRDYKTVDTYDEKRFPIRVFKLFTVVKQFMGDETPKFLLHTDRGERIAASSLNKYVTHRTFNNISESDMFKAVIKQAIRDGDTKRIKYLSSTRGTAIETIMNTYDVT